jgi:hypothetical protein
MRPPEPITVGSRGPQRLREDLLRLLHAGREVLLAAEALGGSPGPASRRDRAQQPRGGVGTSRVLVCAARDPSTARRWSALRPKPAESFDRPPVCRTVIRGLGLRCRTAVAYGVQNHLAPTRSPHRARRAARQVGWVCVPRRTAPSSHAEASAHRAVHRLLPSSWTTRSTASRLSSSAQTILRCRAPRGRPWVEIVVRRVRQRLWASDALPFAPTHVSHAVAGVESENRNRFPGCASVSLSAVPFGFLPYVSTRHKTSSATTDLVQILADFCDAMATTLPLLTRAPDRGESSPRRSDEGFVRMFVART